MVCEVCFHAA